MAVRPLRLTDAVRLFGQRATEAGVEIGPQNRGVVSSICVQLDKLNRAIGLPPRAAAAIFTT